MALIQKQFVDRTEDIYGGNRRISTLVVLSDNRKFVVNWVFVEYNKILKIPGGQVSCRFYQMIMRYIISTEYHRGTAYGLHLSIKG